MNPELKKYFAKIGAKGGKSKSAAKIRAAKQNAQRPRKRSPAMEKG